MKRNEGFLKKNRERHAALRRRNRNINRYTNEINKLKKEDTMIMEKNNNKYFEFLDEHMKKFEEKIDNSKKQKELDRIKEKDNIGGDQTQSTYCRLFKTKLLQS